MVGQIERLGYDDLWLTDSSLHARNVSLRLPRRWSSRLAQRLSSAPRSRTRSAATRLIAAVNAATMDESRPGRAMLGIGAGDRPVEALGFHRRGSTELRERRSRAIRRLLAGEIVTPRPSDARAAEPCASAVRRRGQDPGLHLGQWAEDPGARRRRSRRGDPAVRACSQAGCDFAFAHIRCGRGAAGRPMPERRRIRLRGRAAMARGHTLDEARSIAAWFPQTARSIASWPAYRGIRSRRCESGTAAASSRKRPRPRGSSSDELVVRGWPSPGSQDARRRSGSALGERGVDCINVFPLGPRREHTIREFAACMQEARRARRGVSMGLASRDRGPTASNDDRSE